MGYRLTTQHGYDLYELFSALQKDIRRGNERDALYWACEMVPQFEKALWRRLTVIAHEDIGMGNPLVFVALPLMEQSYYALRMQGNSGSVLILTNAVVLLCRSPKCRLADDLQAVVLTELYRGDRKEIPDYALDNHTARGKAMGRDEAFFHENCLLHPVSEEPNPYAEAARTIWMQPEGQASPAWLKEPLRKGKTQGDLFEEAE